VIARFALTALLAQPVLAPAERISVMDALRAITLDAAWQNFQEREKGSLEPGKQADFAVLTSDPQRTTHGALREIRVRETVIAGEGVWRSATPQ
jgi:predicted amidohydrolase YtcJ